MDEYVLVSLDGKRYYSFAGGDYYDGPQFSTDIRNAKRFTIHGAKNVRGRLMNRKWYGEEFQILKCEGTSID